MEIKIYKYPKDTKDLLIRDFDPNLIGEAVSAISDRVKDLEEGNEPMVLHVDTNTGNLVQTGVSSGKFGIDYESGYLTFTPASN